MALILCNAWKYYTKRYFFYSGKDEEGEKITGIAPKTKMLQGERKVTLLFFFFFPKQKNKRERNLTEKRRD